VFLGGEQLGTGKAQNRKNAEQAAAIEALKNLKEQRKKLPPEKE
jgi:dsRNA-specific ribonuclease